MRIGNAVKITSFGQGRYEFPVNGKPVTIGDALAAHGIDTGGRRLALNGHPADNATGVLEGDEITLVPRVQGG